MAIPTDNALLAAWSTNFNSRLVASPSTWACTPAQATAYTALHEPYIAAYEAASTRTSRSTALVTARNQAKANLLPYARELYAFIQANFTVSAENKDLIGVKNRKTTKTPVGVPELPPSLDVVKVEGRTVTTRIHDDDVLRRGKSPGIKGATVFSFVGDAPPDDVSLWKFEGSTQKNLFSVAFSDSVPAGSQVWLTAFWFNTKSQNGPACDPISTYLQYGVSVAPVAASKSTLKAA